MTRFMPGLLGTGACWLELTGTICARLLVLDASDPTNTLPASPTLSVTVHTEAGVLVATGSASKLDPVSMVTAITPSTALDAATRYRVRWYGDIDGDVVDVYQSARATRHAVQLRVSPITTSELLAIHPTWTDYPTGETSWSRLIDVAWAHVSRRLFRVVPPGEVWAPDVLATPCLHLVEAMWYEQAATYGGSDYLISARYYRALYEAWWESNALGVDRDGDGTMDAVTSAGGQSSAPQPRT